jgi:hypothetical protein
MGEDANQNNTGITINTGNEIDYKGKVIAGFLFIFFTLLAICSLIAFWPDRLPKSDTSAIYRNDLFNICLLDSGNKCETCEAQELVHLSRQDSIRVDSILSVLLDKIQKDLNSIADSAQGNSTIDSAQKVSQRHADSVRISDSLYHNQKPSKIIASSCNNTIRLNTLLLILVATAGFTGTMIHIASSFTNYVGSEKFKKSWMLWYVVKPFTGAALAVVFYFIFRAGLLNFNDTSNINLYGIITLAALAGLFTDKATMKLEELFSVLFRTKDDRPNKLNSDEVNVKITGIKPEALLGNMDNELIISGEGLDKRKFVIKIDEEEIKNPVIKGDSISFTYKLPDEGDKKEFMLRVYDEQGKEIYSSKLLKGEKPADAADTATPAEQETNTQKNSEDLNQEEFGEADAEDETNNPKE